jgi:2-methylisocitrate lyase-like PEP mutase family enzyme
VKNVTHTVQSYEGMGVSAIFLEDQVSPKRCGHMAGKQVVPVEVMKGKLRAAVAARESSDFFIVARTDAREPEGLNAALKRAEHYIECGVDGIYIEAPKSEKELEKIGKAFNGVPQMTNMFEGDDETPFLSPKELHKLGFSMILYPTTLLFRLVRSLEHALRDLQAGKSTPKGEGVSLKEYEQIVGLPHWSEIEGRFQAGSAK